MNGLCEEHAKGIWPTCLVHELASCKESERLMHEELVKLRGENYKLRMKLLDIQDATVTVPARTKFVKRVEQILAREW